MRTSLYCGKLARLVIVLSAVTAIYHTQWWSLLLPVQNAAPALAPRAPVTVLRHVTSSHNAFIQGKPSREAYNKDNVTALSNPSLGTHKEDNVTALSNPSLGTHKEDNVTVLSNPSLGTHKEDNVTALSNPSLGTHKEDNVTVLSNPSLGTHKEDNVTVLSNPSLGTHKEDNVTALSNPSLGTHKEDNVTVLSNPSLGTHKEDNVTVLSNPSLGTHKEDNVTALSNPSLGTHKEDNVTALSNPSLGTHKEDNVTALSNPSLGTHKEDNVTALSNPSLGTHKEDNVTALSNPSLGTHKEDRMSAGDTDRYVIYYCKGACGGWADRLKGIAIAYVIANLTHRRFGIKIPDIPCPLREFLVPAEVPWDLPDSLDLQSGAKMYNKMDSGAFYKSMPSVNLSEVLTARVALFKANLDYFDLLKQNALYERQLQWMRPLTNDQIFARIFHQLFRPAPRVARALQAVLASARPSPDHTLLCAHVRFASNSEMLRDSQRRHTTAHGHTVLRFLQSLDPASPLFNVTTATAALPASYAPTTAALPPPRAKAGNYRFFVTSDSQVYIDQAGKVFGARFVRTSGQFVHVDRKGGQRGQEVCEGFTKVLVDQQLLARCDVLVVSKSGLSRQAAYIRGTDRGLYCILMTGQLVKCQPSHLRQLYHVIG